MSNTLSYPSNTPVSPPGFVSPPPPGQQYTYQAGAINSPPPPPPPPPKAGPIVPDYGNAVPARGGMPQHPGQPMRSSTQGSFSGMPPGGPSQASPHQQPNFTPQSPGGPVPSTTGEQWLPELLRDKSKTDLEAILNDPTLLSAMLQAPSTTHPSLPASQAPLHDQLAANVALATAVLGVEAQIQHVRGTLGPSLVRVAALERQFRAKQEAMDDALAPWAPKAVHVRLGQGVQEQAAWCEAMEESFLDGSGGGDGEAGAGGSAKATDREVGEWLRKYKEGRKVLELRREKKLRLEEGRVGGWK